MNISPSVYLTDLSPVDKPWDKHRAMAAIVQQLYAGTDLQRYADRIAQCSTLLGFTLTSNEQGEVSIRLQNASFCRVRHCPVCQWRRSRMWLARMKKALPGILERYPRHRWLFLTLTVRNCDIQNLRTCLTEMNDAWKRLTSRSKFPGVGWVRTTEVTRNPITGQAHPHFHGMILVPQSYFKGKGYIKQKDWGELWRDCLRADYTPIVNVKAIKIDSNLTQLETTEAISKALVETLKYSIKPEDLVVNQDFLLELTKQLHKTRAVNVGGVLKDFIREDEPEELIHSEDEQPEIESLDDIDLWFGWREMVKRYLQTARS